MFYIFFPAKRRLSYKPIDLPNSSLYIITSWPSVDAACREETRPQGGQSRRSGAGCTGLSLRFSMCACVRACTRAFVWVCVCVSTWIRGYVRTGVCAFARGVIATVYQRMKFEAENGVERVTDARWRTSKAVGVSERTVTRILKQNEKVIQLARC
ncbi:hypothetical protein EVAR_41348_1 [Eumeta japonica]|uniref:Uncharacterized protein n=1 Tax=Eumeta variegata TaxID=151549 RepID=A0A4C1XPG0_EUMVA|nr:hypothetical protein EVAR_41348_1 [Eumeta japonica]